MNLSPRLQKLGAAALALALFVALALALRSPESWAQGRSGTADDLDALTTAIFTKHVVALEVLGILLTAAMIGALVIARPLGSVEDRSHYAHVSAEEFERTVRMSDPDADPELFRPASAEHGGVPGRPSAPSESAHAPAATPGPEEVRQ